MLISNLIGKVVIVSLVTKDGLKYLCGELLDVDNNFIKLKTNVVSHFNLDYVFEIAEKQN